ncbi:hypothetical protein H7X46_25920 [Pseudonocardia sp. C8]|uniref:hypothetical protein n=1 Tax=Pseudonocardia sp. C8 TaxID=2762759 RepID=UPI001642A0B0|nr:hypothetical protein [Pseudonocardia sp. C8]MBC3194491.1 hypothetical protein [Pseudonocardia sp. C8]
MSRAPAPLVALVGCKRSRFAMAGRHRVLTVRDGRVRILGRQGAVDLDAPVGAVTARLTRTRTVELRTDATSVYVFGVLELGNLHRELQQIAADASAGAELIGPEPSGFLGIYSPKAVTGTARISSAIAEALHERGVGQGE